MNKLSIHVYFLGRFDRLIKIEEMLKERMFEQCRYVMFKGTMTTWPVQKPTYYITTQKHVEHHDATVI